jgi:hypothetical protein
VPRKASPPSVVNCNDTAAPFELFSSRMHKTFDQLMINRTWIFESSGELWTR